VADGIAVAIHGGHLQLQRALKRAGRSGLDLRSVSVVGTDYHTEENVYGYYSAGRRLEAWGGFGSFWTYVWGTLTGGGFFFIPGIGPVVMAGPMVGWLVAALQKGSMVSGLSPLGAALVGKGVPQESMLKYETALQSNELLLITSGFSLRRPKASPSSAVLPGSRPKTGRARRARSGRKPGA
jgi:hypothetical protein